MQIYTVESQNRHLKKAIEQALILRGSRDFACIEDDRRFIDMLVARRNRQRADAVQAERVHLKPLPQRRTTDFTGIVVPVNQDRGASGAKNNTEHANPGGFKTGQDGCRSQTRWLTRYRRDHP